MKINSSGKNNLNIKVLNSKDLSPSRGCVVKSISLKSDDDLNVETTQTNIFSSLIFLIHMYVYM